VGAVALAFLASRILFLGLTLRTYVRIAPPGHPPQGRRLATGWQRLQDGLPFAAEAGLTNFQAQADTLIVHHFLGAGAVGVYQAGLRLMQGANTFAQVLGHVYLPSMAAKAADGHELKRLTKRLFLQMLLLGTGALLVFGLGAARITHTLYGSKFQQLSALLPWFGVLLFIRYIAASHGVTLSAVGLQSTRVAAISVALAALFAGACLWVPQQGLHGMLYASIAAAACLSIVYALALVRKGYPLGMGRLNALALSLALALAFFVAWEI
jgi:O-antigen/teichoic acid export membrane protein